MFLERIGANNRYRLYIYTVVLALLSVTVYAFPKVIEKEPEQWVEEGYAYLEAGDFEKAVDCAEEAEDIDPTTPMLYDLKGTAYAEMGLYEKALDDLDKAIELYPMWAPTYATRALLKVDTGNSAGAVEDATSAVLLDPNFAFAKVVRGKAYILIGEEAKGLEDLNEVITVEPETDILAQAYRFRGAAYEEMGNTLRAEADYDAALSLRPDDVEMIVRRADLDWKKGDKDAALDRLLRTAELLESLASEGPTEWTGDEFKSDPRLYELSEGSSGIQARRWAAAGFIYSAYITDYDKATECYTTAIDSEPPADIEPLLYASRGAAYAADGYFDKAKKDIDKALKLDKDYVGAYVSRALIKAAEGDYGKAVKDCKKAIKLSPENPDLYLLRALIQIEKGDIDKALEDLEVCLTIDRDNAVALVFRAWVNFAKAQTYSFSKVFYSDVARLLGQSEAAYDYWALYSEKEKESMEKALADLDKAAEVLPGEPRLYYVRGLINTHSGKFKDALSDFERALAVGFDNKEDEAWTYYYKASIFAASGYSKEAFVDLRKSIELMPRIKSFASKDNTFTKLNNSAISALFENADDLSADAWQVKGLESFNEGKYLAAAVYYSNSLRRDSEKVEPLKNRGISYFMAGLNRLAVDDFSTVLDGGSSDVDVLAYRGFVYTKMGFYDKALVDLNRVIDERPDYAAAYTYRGYCYSRIGRYKEALDDLFVAMDLDVAQSSVAIYTMAWVYTAIDQRDKALEHLRMAIEINPDFKRTAVRDPRFYKYREDLYFQELTE